MSIDERKILHDARKTVKDFEENPLEKDNYHARLKRTQYQYAKNYLKRRIGDTINCMDEYKFISEMKTKAFGDLMNELCVAHLLMDEKHNLSEMLERDIVNPIKRGTFAVFAIIGQAGAGKSELAQIIAFKSRDANKKYKHRDVTIHLVWTQGDFNEILPNLKMGDIIWKDEMPKTLRTGARVEKWQMDNVLHIIRKYENTLIFIDPVEVKVNICDIYFQAAGMNFDARMNRFMVLNIDNILYKQYRYLGHIRFKLHNNEEFREWYKNKKDLFIKEMLKKSGDVRAKKPKNVIDMVEVEEKEPLLLEDNHTIEEKSFKDNITEEKVFATIRKEVRWIKTERDIEIFKEHKSGKLIEEIMKDRNMGESTVKRAIRHVQGAIYKYKGLLFEKEYFKWLKELKMYDKVIWDGGSGKPDVYAYDGDDRLHIFSLKNFAIKKRPFHIKAELFGAELKKAYREHLEGNYNEIKVFAVVYDSIASKTERIELDYLKPESITLH